MTQQTDPGDAVERAGESAAVRWGRLVRQQRESGLSVKAFCAAQGLCVSSLFAWRRKLMQPPMPFAAVSVVPQPVQVVDGDATESHITLCLPQGRSLRLRRGFDRQLLLDLLGLLDTRPTDAEDRP